MAAIQAALARPRPTDCRQPSSSVASSQPAFTTEDAKAWKGKLKPIGRARWTTHFPQGERNFFGKNIFIPTGFINGYVVRARRAGSTSGRSSARSAGRAASVPAAPSSTAAREPTGALAGGICSCSTTLFNAALRYGLEMGDRRNHYYYITRYPLGLDATVFKSGGGSVQSMSFKNDTDVADPDPRLDTASASSTSSSGRSTPDVASAFSRPTVRNIRPAATDRPVHVIAARPDDARQIEFPATGKDVWVTRFGTRSERQAAQQETFYSHYARVTGIILVGALVRRERP